MKIIINCPRIFFFSLNIYDWALLWARKEKTADSIHVDSNISYIFGSLLGCSHVLSHLSFIRRIGIL